MEKIINIGVRLSRDKLIDIERFIVKEGLHRYRVRPSYFATLIIKDWLKNPILDKSKLTYGYIKNNPKINRISVNLTEEEHIKLYEIYVKDYIRECSSINVLIYNVITQFLDEDTQSSIYKRLGLE